MTPEEIEALALHRAAEVARKYADDCRADADDLISKGHTFLAQRETSAAADASEIEGRILALAPVSPLQAALEVPEVKALVEAGKSVLEAMHARLNSGIRTPVRFGAPFGELNGLTAALAALEESHD